MDPPVVVVTHEAPADRITAHPGAPFTFVALGDPTTIVQRDRVTHLVFPVLP